MSVTRLFLLRAVGLLLLFGAAATWFMYGHKDWGIASVYCVCIAMTCAFGMGFVSFKLAVRGILQAGSQITPVMGALLGGMVICMILLFASWGLANEFLGLDWGTRALFTTLGFYLLMMMVKVVTLSQELRRGKETAQERQAAHD